MFSTESLLNIYDTNSSKRRFIEFLFSTLIILILITLSIPIYSDCRLKAEIIHLTGELDTGINMYTFHAVNGTWPVSNEQLAEFEKEMGLSIHNQKKEPVESRSDFIKKTEIKNGALNVVFKGNLDRQVLSLRPAVPEADKTGPVILVCNKDKSGWTIAGKDETTIDETLINRFLR